MRPPKLNIPSQALDVLTAIESAGSKGYFAGPCIAELKRGGSPMDYDIITNADFEELLYIFRDMRIISQNEAMSTVMVSALGLVVQVSTYRSSVSDGKAVYTDNYILDLASRDFSAFAMAYHPRKGIKDPFDGESCIKDGKITLKALGEYPIRLWRENDLDNNELTLKLSVQSSLISEPFNILKALRLAAGENYLIDRVTASSIRKNAELIRGLPHRELFRSLTSLLLSRNISSVIRDYPEVFTAAAPELSDAAGCNDEYGGLALWEHIARTVEFSPPFEDLRYAALFHNAGFPHCKCICSDGSVRRYGHAEYARILLSSFFERSKADKQLRLAADFLLELHDTVITDDRVELKRLMKRLGEKDLKRLIKLRIADDTANPEVHEGKIAMYRRALQAIDDIVDTKECYSPSMLAIKPSDLVRTRLAADMGQAEKIINTLFEAVLEQPKLNVAPVLTDMVKKSCRR